MLINWRQMAKGVRGIVTLRRFMQSLTFYLYNHVVSNFPIYSVRHFFLKFFFCVDVGRDSSVHMGCFITGNRISIGKNTVINRRCYLDGRTGIRIGDNVSISPEVYILSLSHIVDDPYFNAIGAEVVIGDYVWLGARAIIMPGVTLGDGCVVGAGSVVTKNFPPYSIIAGMPAKFIKKRNSDLMYTLKYFPFFDTDI